MFQRYQKPTSLSIVYTGPNQNLGPDALAITANKNKLLWNDSNGTIQFLDYGPLDDIVAYPTYSDFPAVGDAGKMYLDTSLNKVYRYESGAYYYFPHNVYSKTEVDGAIASEASTRSTNDTTLTNNLNAEIANRIAAINTVISNYQAADTTLQNNINTEASTRATQDALRVPYTGASTAVNLGSQNLSTTGTATIATATLTTLNAPSGTLQTQCHDNRNNYDLFNINNLYGVTQSTTTTANITTENTTTANITNLKPVNLKSSNNVDIATISDAGIDFFSTGINAGGIRFGKNKTGARESNEGKIYYDDVTKRLTLVGGNNDGTWANDNAIQLYDNVYVGNALNVTGTVTSTNNDTSHYYATATGGTAQIHHHTNFNNLDAFNLNNIYNVASLACTEGKITQLGLNLNANGYNINGIQDLYTNHIYCQTGTLNVHHPTNFNSCNVSNVGTLNGKTIDDFVKPIVFTQTAAAGVNLFEYNCPANYKIYSAQWSTNDVPEHGTTHQSTYLKLQRTFSGGENVQCRILLVHD